MICPIICQERDHAAICASHGALTLPLLGSLGSHTSIAEGHGTCTMEQCYADGAQTQPLMAWSNIYMPLPFRQRLPLLGTSCRCVSFHSLSRRPATHRKKYSRQCIERWMSSFSGQNNCHQLSVIIHTFALPSRDCPCYAPLVGTGDSHSTWKRFGICGTACSCQDMRGKSHPGMMAVHIGNLSVDIFALPAEADSAEHFLQAQVNP